MARGEISSGGNISVLLLVLFVLFVTIAPCKCCANGYTMYTYVEVSKEKTTNNNVQNTMHHHPLFFLTKKIVTQLSQ